MFGKGFEKKENRGVVMCFLVAVYTITSIVFLLQVNQYTQDIYDFPYLVSSQARIMKSRLIPGATVGLHNHEGSSDIIYILEGSGKVLYDGNEFRIEAGQVHYCPEGHEHSLINDSESDLVFFAVVPQQ